MQAGTIVDTTIMQIVVVIMSKVHDSTSVKFDVDYVLTYVQKMFALREMIKLQKEWEDEC